MKSVLHIDSSPNFETSYSRKYSKKVVDAIFEEYPDSVIMRRDLVLNSVPHVTNNWFNGAYTEESKRNYVQKVDLAVSEVLIEELLSATHVVLGSPMHNFSICSYLKTYIDQITRINKTFTSDFKGLAMGKKVYLVMARGGSKYEVGEQYHHMNFQESYLRAMLKYIGIEGNDNVQCIRINNTAKANLIEMSMKAADEELKKLKF